MRTAWCYRLFAVTLSAATLGSAGLAHAQNVVDPYGQAMPVAPPPAAVVVQPPPMLDYPQAVPPPPPPRRRQVIINGSFRAGPVQLDGQVQVGGPPVAYPAVPYPPYPPPVFYPPPPIVYQPYRQYPVYVPSPQLICNACATRRPVKKWDGVRRFSLGVHAMVMGINQKVGNNDMVLGGAGLQLRIRSAGHIGFEMAQSFLHASYWNGGYTRDSFPFTTSMLFYLRHNRDDVHWNLYGVAGVGVMPDTVSVRFSPGDLRSQDMLEWEAHVGAGAELRFKWFSLDVEGRYAGLWRDNSDVPAAYYQGIPGGPIPESSQAWVATAHLNIWF